MTQNCKKKKELYLYTLKLYKFNEIQSKSVFIKQFPLKIDHYNEQYKNGSEYKHLLLNSIRPYNTEKEFMYNLINNQFCDKEQQKQFKQKQQKFSFNCCQVGHASLNYSAYIEYSHYFVIVIQTKFDLNQILKHSQQAYNCEKCCIQNYIFNEVESLEHCTACDKCHCKYLKCKAFNLQQEEDCCIICLNQLQSTFIPVKNYNLYTNARTNTILQQLQNFSVLLPCGHKIDKQCIIKSIQHGIVSCAYCKSYIIDRAANEALRKNYLRILQEDVLNPPVFRHFSVYLQCPWCSQYSKLNLSCITTLYICGYCGLFCDNNSLLSSQQIRALRKQKDKIYTIKGGIQRYASAKTVELYLQKKLHKKIIVVKEDSAEHLSQLFNLAMNLTHEQLVALVEQLCVKGLLLEEKAV